MDKVRFIPLVLLLALTALISYPAAAQVARPGDRAVIEMIERTQETISDFTSNLDRDLRRATIRSSTSEVNVDSYLEDFATDVDRLRERFKPQYAASAELVTVLRKANDIEQFVKSQPPSFKGRSEWDAAAAALNSLAAAYGTTFPAPQDVTARRVNDAEIQQAADAIVKNANSSRKALKNAFTKEESAALSQVQEQFDSLSKAAKALKARIKAGKPASGEAGVLREQLAVTEAGLSGRTLDERGAVAWRSITVAAAKIDDAFAAGGVRTAAK